jgi:hypothetical protein
MIAYVDDILMLTPDKQMAHNCTEELKRKLHISDQGPVNYFLGIRIFHDTAKKRYELDQEALIDRICARHLPESAKPSLVPMATGLQLVACEPTNQPSKEYTSEYQQIIGGLLHLSRCTRPDIAFAVSLLSRFASRPSHAHMECALRVLRYTLGTKAHKLIISGAGGAAISGMSDADWAGDKVQRASTSGYIIKIGLATVAWASKRQNCTSISTMEAEYVALSELAREITWIRSILAEMEQWDQTTPMLSCDNQSALAISKNPLDHQRSKHIDIRFHHIRTLIEQGVINVKWIATDKNEADGLTKALSKSKFNQFKQMIHIQVIAANASREWGSVGKGIAPER